MKFGKRIAFKIIQKLTILAAITYPALAQAEWASAASADDGSWGVATSKKTKQIAIAESIKNCKKYTQNKCTTFFTTQKPGYFVVSASPSRTEASLGDNEEVAKDLSLEGCAKHTPPSETCSIKWSGINGSVHTAVQNNLYSQTDCRPRTEYLKCSSQCTNGNCIISYENGCKIRVQVNPRFDSFSNQWIYPSPGC